MKLRVFLTSIFILVYLFLSAQTPSIEELMQLHNVSDIYMKTLSPSAGSLIYNTDKTSIYQYNGSSWVSLATYKGSSGSVLFVRTNGSIGEHISNFYYEEISNSLFLGSGLLNTGNKLNINGSIFSKGLNNSSGALNSPSYRFAIDPNTGFYLPLADNLSFVTNAVEALRIDENQNIGIGTASPQEKLHIAANMQLDGYFKDSQSEVGTPGQILSSSSQGTTWVDKADYSLPIVIHKTGDYTLQLDDSGKVFTFNSSNPVTLNIPEGLPKGFNISVYQLGIGQVEIIGLSSVEVKHRLYRFKTAGQDSGIGIISTQNNIYHLTGDLSN